MSTITDPIVDNWYKDLENNLSFRVVTVDDKDDNIEVQYLNGDLGSFDKDSWYNSTIDFIEAPEDWSAPYDEIENDDLGYSDTDLHYREYDAVKSGDWLDD